MSNSDHLKKALETYEKNRDSLIAQGIGRYALIHGDDVIAVWETYEDALKAGYEKFGVDGKFVVKKIQGPVDGIQFFTRDILSCPP